MNEGAVEGEGGKVKSKLNQKMARFWFKKERKSLLTKFLIEFVFQSP